MLYLSDIMHIMYNVPIQLPMCLIQKTNMLLIQNTCIFEYTFEQYSNEVIAL